MQQVSNVVGMSACHHSMAVRHIRWRSLSLIADSARHADSVVIQRKGNCAMNGIDPTIALPANITGFKGRLSVEAVAAMQAHEIRMAEAMAGIAESTTEGGERQPS